jgi:hypothetical protein
MTAVTRRQFGGILGLAGIGATGLWIGGFPGVRGHGDDGQRRHPLTFLPVRALGRTEFGAVESTNRETGTGGYAPGLPGHTRPSFGAVLTVSCR